MKQKFVGKNTVFKEVIMSSLYGTAYFCNKEVEFYKIDNNCSTMRNGVAWKSISSSELIDLCKQSVVQKILMSYRIGYYKLAIVHSTYPILDITYSKIWNMKFIEFWNANHRILFSNWYCWTLSG